MKVYYFSSRVDYFSLDIEGPELEVLQTLPWDKVDITAISVETEFFGEFEVKKLAIKELLENQGRQLEDTNVTVF